MNARPNHEEVAPMRYRIATAAPVLLAALTLASTLAHAAPTARIEASRASGPAPLAVHFDATTTTDSSSSVDTFRQIGYRFEFGDSAAGTWQHSSLSKNEQIGGPIAAHVFERPGTYVVRVTAKDAAGATSIAQVTINVSSPDSVFGGTSTVCLSRNSDFSGCPSGAQQIANASSWPSFASSRRYLLRAGQDFSSLGTVNLGRTYQAGLSDTQIGAFGSGAKPIVQAVNVHAGDSPSSWPARIVVSDLAPTEIMHYYSGSDLLLFRNSLTRGGSITLAHAFEYMLGSSSQSGWQVPQRLFVVENEVRGNGQTSTVTGEGSRLAFMGNLIERTDQHNLRLWQGQKVFVAHNRLNGIAQDPYRVVFKMHSAGIAANLVSLTTPQQFSQRSSEVIFANNQAGSSNNNGQWIVAVCPQNGESAEGVERAILEDNTFYVGSNFVTDIAWGGRNLTERGNRNTSNSAVRITVGHADSLPADWRGPYYANQASMRARFASSGPVPLAPVLTDVQ